MQPEVGLDLDAQQSTWRVGHLRKADLQRSTTWADLREADLRGADLSRVNPRQANLSEADLSGANLLKSGAPT
ncbi:MAG: pentapeptide repeat-containing protein [Ardenticatenales bacterium]|nr:pentapeptide repeat-containing protein [Ardenticatenales bacterium]